MSDEINQADTLIIKPSPIEMNGQSSVNHMLSKSLEVKVSNENKNGHETLDEQSCKSSPSHIDQCIDSGLSSDVTYTELEKANGDDELSSTSAVSSTNHQRESSPTSGVIIPEEKRVTDRVKVFEAVANNNDNQMTKNGNKKKSSLTSSSFSIGDHKQISSSTETFDTQSITEVKSSKNKSKKSSLKKQIQNLLKIDKSPVQDELNTLEEHIHGKKNKKDHSKKPIYTRYFLLILKWNFYLDSSPATTATAATISITKQQSSPKTPIELSETKTPPSANNTEVPSSTNVSKLINTFQANDTEQAVVVSKLNTPPSQSENVSSL